MGKIVQEAMAVARLASQGGWGKEPPPPTILKSPGAIQGQCRSPSPHPQAAAPGDELGRIRRGPTSAGKPDSLVQRGGDRGLARRAPHHAWRPALLLGAGDHHGADAAGGVPPALRQTEGLIGSILRLLGLGLAVPDHTTLSRRAETLEVPRSRSGSEPVHLLVDSTGLKLGGPGEG